MLASFQRVSGLINRSSPSSAVSSKSFLRKEFQGLKVDLNLEARGQKSGARGLPSTAETALDAVEADIINTVLSVQQRAFSQLEKTLSDLQQAVDFLDLEGRLARIRVAAAAGLPDLAGELQFKIDGLQQLRRDATEAEGWHRKFRAHNHLDRPSKVISRTSLVLLWLVVVACIAMATFVNVALLDKQGAVGWFDGWMVGLILAILSIGVAILFALYGVPALWHRSLPKRLIGIASILTYLALTVLLNLALAHYREVSGGLAQGAGQTILRRLLQTPFMLDDPYSWLLAGLGVILSLVALLAVLGMRDLYPGYAQAAEISRAARARHEASRARLVDELGSIRATFEAELTAARADLIEQCAEHDDLMSQRHAVLARFEAFQNQLERDGNAALKLYRDANSAARPTSPPLHFQQPFELTRVQAQGRHYRGWDSADLKARIRTAQGHLDWLLLQLQRLYEAGIAEQVADPALAEAVAQLAELARARGTSIAELAQLGVDAATGSHDWPPVIALGDEQLPFSPESAEISPSSREQIRTTVMNQVLDLLKRYPADILEVVGHTDERPVSNSHASTLDSLAIPALWGEEPASRLMPADNAGLGLARAIAVATELAAIGPDRLRIIPLSAAQLLLPGDQLSRGRDTENHAGRQRIEIRLRKSTAAAVT